jgi:hypothetical protein
MAKGHEITSHLLRISPIVCATEAVIAVCSVGWYKLVHRTSLRKAAKAWALDRFEDDQRGLDTHPAWRLVPFAFAVSQAVKLLACTGIRWTKTWACLYLGSFLIMEFLIRLSYTVQDYEYLPVFGSLDSGEPSRYDYSPDNIHLEMFFDSAPSTLLWPAVVIHLLSSPIVLGICIPCPSGLCHWENPSGPVFLFWIFPTIPLRLGFFAICLPLILLTEGGFEHHADIFIWHFLVATFMTCLVWSLPSVQGSLLPENLGGVIRFMGRFMGFGRAGNPWRRRRGSVNPDRFARAALALFIGVMLGYATHYNSSDTYRPPWTDKLG